MRLIDADALLDFLSDERKEAQDNKRDEMKRGNDYEMHFWAGALVLIRWIKRYISVATTIEAEPVRHGEWIINNIVIDNNGRTMPDYPECSECEKKSDLEYNYCPNCGAKMDGDMARDENAR